MRHCRTRRLAGGDLSEIVFEDQRRDYGLQHTAGRIASSCQSSKTDKSQNGNVAIGDIETRPKARVVNASPINPDQSQSLMTLL